MRITQGLEQSQFLASLDSLESTMATTQNGITTGLAFTTPSQDPAAAGSVNALDQVLAQSQQFSTNATSANSGLETESNALGQLQTQLQSVYSLAVEANSGTQSASDLSAIAAQVTAIQSTMLSIANTQDGSGNYIFAGYATQAAPFALTATGASYVGDTGQAQVQVAAGQTVATGDSGDAVFNRIKNGNGTFTVTPGASNTGTGVIGSTSVTNLSATGTSQPYAGQSFTINFTSAYNTATSSSTYQIITVPATVPTPTGTYTSGQPISYGGVQINLTGAPAFTAATVGPPATPAVGDSFAVGPSTNQSIFTTMQNLITALQAPSSTPAAKAQLNNSIAAALNGLNAAITNTGTIEAQVGGRLNSITTAQSVATSQQLQLKTSISSLQSLDYTSAATMLTAEQTQLSAAMESFTLTQGLTLFKYISP
jgi:flagellar hook-associated protein 3 FlgL